MTEDKEGVCLNPCQTVTQVGKNHKPTCISIAFGGLERTHTMLMNDLCRQQDRQAHHPVIHSTHLLSSYYVPGNTLGVGDVWISLFNKYVYMFTVCQALA